MWNDQNEQETEDLVELPSRLVQSQVYEGYFVGLRLYLKLYSAITVFMGSKHVENSIN